jgi:phosphate transport system substrate-binding protein
MWTADYNKRAGVTVTYGAIGSGGGIAAITDRTVDFGASDAPLTPDQQASCNGCLQLPWALGGTAIAYNVNGAPPHLRLTGTILAGIYLDQVKTWDDPAIAKLNPTVNLPATRITPVFRSDSSGTSYNFTDYLAAVSPEAKSKVGVSTQPAFPTGVGAKGSSGVAGVLTKTDGAIGYVDVAYARQSNLSYAAVRNAANNFELPTVGSVGAAAAAAPSPKPNAGVSIVDPPASATRAKTLRDFLTYAVTIGQAFGPRLQFAPLPPRVVAADKRAIAQIR